MSLTARTLASVLFWIQSFSRLGEIRLKDRARLYLKFTTAFVLEVRSGFDVCLSLLTETQCVQTFFIKRALVG